MDLNTIQAVVRPRSRAELPPRLEGDAFLGGGTWLYSEPQPHLSRLVDLSGLGWEPLVASANGLEIAATCTIAQLNAASLPAAWSAAPLIGQCCRALLASFKVWNMATVGGNLCMALPAGAMISLTAALDGACRIWAPDGAERQVSVFDFVADAGRNALATGEILRSIHLPAAVLSRRAAFRQMSLMAQGRSAALVIGTLGDDGFSLTVTASTPRPVRLEFPTLPGAAELEAAIEATLPPEAYFEDVHGRRPWRRAVTLHLSEEVRRELEEGRAP